MKKFLLVNSKTNSNKTSTTTIYGHKHMIVEGGGSIISDSVMNGILYPREFVEKLANNTKEIPAPFSHPSDDNGNFLLAESVQALVQNWGGVHARNWRMDGDRLVRDIAIDMEVTGNAKKDELVKRIENGEDCDTSTGLILNLKDESGIGKDGEEYNYVATDGYLNHDAILLNEIGAATSNMGVGVTANTKDGEIEVIEYNASMPNLNLPLAPLDTKWDASAADKLIREYTNSGDEPSSTYRRFFMYFDREDVKNYTAYKLPFATVIDGRPYAVLNAINNASSRLSQTKGLSKDDKAKAQRVIDTYQAKAEKMKKTNSSDESWIKTNLKLVMNKLGIKPSHETNEDNSMDKLKAALNEAGIDITGMSDDQIYAAHNKMIIANAMKEGGKEDDSELSDEEKKKLADEKAAKDKAAKDKMKGNSADVPDYIKALNARLDKFESRFTANEQAELDKAAKSVAALNMGIDETAAKAMGLTACNAFLDKNKGVVNWRASGTQFSTNSDEGCMGLELPE